MSLISLDIETFGLTPKATIISIGACVFYPEDDKVGTRFYRSVHVNQQPGRLIEAAAALWWMDQPEAARAAIITDANRIHLGTALGDLAVFLGEQSATEVWAKHKLDFTVLDDAYADAGFASPWHYRAERDLATLEAVALRAGAARFAPDHKPEHHALADAVHQARAACHYLRHFHKTK